MLITNSSVRILFSFFRLGGHCNYIIVKGTKVKIGHKIIFSNMSAHLIISCRYGKIGGRELLHIL